MKEQTLMKQGYWGMRLEMFAFPCLLLFQVALFSCTPSPLWENPASSLRQVDKRLAGAWGQSGYPVVFIGDPLDGWMSFVVSSRGDSEQKIFGSFYVSKIAERNFLNVKIRVPWDLSDFYFIAEYRIDSSGNLFVALPNHDFVKKALKNNRLTGRIEESENGAEILVLSSDTSDIRAFIEESPKESLFPQSPADVLKRFR